MTVIHIEPLRQQHSKALLEFASNPLVSKTSSFSPNYDVNTINLWVLQIQLAAQAMVFTVIVDGKRVGCSVLKSLDWQARKAELSYWLGMCFLGLGPRAPQADLGVMIAEARIVCERALLLLIAPSWTILLISLLFSGLDSNATDVDVWSK